MKGLTTKWGFRQSGNDLHKLWGDFFTNIIVCKLDGIITSNNETDVDRPIADIASVFEITMKGCINDSLVLKNDRKLDRQIL